MLMRAGKRVPPSVLGRWDGLLIAPVGPEFRLRRPERRHVRADPHSINYADTCAEWSTTAEDERVITSATANCIKACANSLCRRHAAVCPDAIKTRGVREVQLQVGKAQANEFAG